MKVAIVVDELNSKSEKLAFLVANLHLCQADISNFIYESYTSLTALERAIEVELLGHSPCLCVGLINEIVWKQLNLDGKENWCGTHFYLEKLTKMEFFLAVVGKLAHWTGCLILGVLIKAERRLDFASRAFFSLECQKVRLIVIPIDLEAAIELVKWDNLHGLLMKTSDFKDQYWRQKLDDFLECLDQNPHIYQIDREENIQKVLARSCFPKLLEPKPYHNFSNLALFPNNFILDQPVDEEDFLKTLHRHGMIFPVIVKSDLACGGPKSHYMAIVMDISQIHEIEVDYPLQVQQFLPHGNSLWKVYVAGEKVFIQEEATLGCLTRIPSMEGILHFNALDEKKANIEHDSYRPNLNESCIHETASLLRENTSLSIFGFDIIITNSGQHLIIDVNYFPSMKRIENSVETIHECCYQKISSYFIKEVGKNLF